jgi:hypothetical protein
MLVLIYPKVFNVDSNIVMRHLDRLLLLFESGKHEWFLKVDTDTLMSWRWPKQLSLRHQTILKEIAEKSFVKTSQISIKEKRARGIVEVDFDSEQSIENWINLLEEPLFIVVENETSDKTFLNRLFQIYGEPGKMLMKALNKSHLTFYPAGGRNETIKILKPKV